MFLLCPTTLDPKMAPVNNGTGHCTHVHMAKFSSEKSKDQIIMIFSKKKFFCLPSPARIHTWLAIFQILSFKQAKGCHDNFDHQLPMYFFALCNLPITYVLGNFDQTLRFDLIYIKSGFFPYQ
jgi:hypothetical protein